MRQALTSWTATAVISMGIAVPAPPAPVSAEPPELPEVTADAWIIYDATSEVVLAGKDIDTARAMASVTKAMTALVVRDHAGLDELTRVSAVAADIGEAEVGLFAGERWSVEDLLYAIMVRSGNDAAIVLAEHVGGQVAGFVELMNARAAEMGLENTSFANPHGLDAEGHYSSPRDLALIGAAVLDDPVLARMARTRRVVFKQAPDGTARIVGNTNHLLGVYPGIAGVKTGYTGRAGLVLISALVTPERTLIGVVMHSDEHFDDSRELLDYGSRVVTLRDRFEAPLLPEEGGGAVTGDVALDETARIRLAAVLPLSTDRGRVTALAGTTTGRLLDARLRSLLPVVLGGTG